MSNLPKISLAANRYVRQGATGANNGTDWTNAYTSLPATLTRGDTYYIADGTYSSYTFDDAISGTTYISIKKAIAADHGIDTGWNSTDGDGQAVFGPLTASNTGYIEMNGQYQYGFKIDFNEGQSGFRYNSSSQYMRFLYVDFDGITNTGNYNYNSSTKCVYVPGNVGAIDGFLMSHSACHGGETLIQWERGNNAVFEYNDFYDNRSTASNWHSNIMYITGNSQNVTFRYNKVHNYNVEGLFVTGYGGSGSGNWYIYGNVFYDGIDVARALELRQDYSYGAFFFFNNTCINLPVGCINSLGPTTGSIARNNIIYNAGMGGTTYGSWVTSDNSSVSINQFVDYSTDNFHLASATLTGYSLASPYNVDMDGNTRGADGTWDRGAYEYLASGPPPPDIVSPSIPANLIATPISSSQINLSWNVSTDNIGVAGYRVFRNGIQIAAPTAANYSNTGLNSSTTYTYAVSAYDAAGNASSQSTPVQADTLSVSSSPFYEAESCALALPMQIISDSIASGSQYIQTSTSESGTANCSFSITASGIYKIIARVFASNTASDSFYFRIDSIPEDIWDLNPSAAANGFNVWREDDITKRGSGTFDNPQYDPYTLNLTAGTHTLSFRGRESSAKLDYFYLTRVTDTTPPSASTGLVAQ